MRFRNQYAEDGKARRRQVREDAGNRCVRCRHPYFGRGEWTPCDEQCEHMGPVRVRRNKDSAWTEFIPNSPHAAAANHIAGLTVEAQWRILTVHHLDGDKENDAWWNCLSLCQRCHLTIQGKVIPEIPYFLEHSPWFRPYAAGFYAKKYEGRDITREEAIERMDELLAYELAGAKKD